MVRSYPIRDFNTQYVYETVRTHCIFAIFILVNAWGDCLDRSLHSIMQKKSKTLGWFFQFMRKCEKEYTAYSIFILDSYIPTKGKAAFLNALYSKYQSIVKPWIIGELKKKRKKTRDLESLDIQDPKQTLLDMVQHITEACIVLFKYKGTCLQKEVHDILKQAKPKDFWLLKQPFPKITYDLASSKWTILKPIRVFSNVASNIRHSTCDATDARTKKFVHELADIILTTPRSTQLLQHIIRQFQKISV